MNLFLVFLVLIAIGMFSFAKETGLNPFTGAFCRIVEFNVNAGRVRERIWYAWVKVKDRIYDRHTIPLLYAELIGPLPPPDWRYPTVVYLRNWKWSPDNEAITIGRNYLSIVLEPDGFTKEQKAQALKIFLGLAKKNAQSAEAFAESLHRAIWPQSPLQPVSTKPDHG
jgi:hypothetical protein